MQAKGEPPANSARASRLGRPAQVSTFRREWQRRSLSFKTRSLALISSGSVWFQPVRARQVCSAWR